MDIYVIGTELQVAEIGNKISEGHTLKLIDDVNEINASNEVAVFDFIFDDSPDDLERYAGFSNVNLFINSTRISLTELTFFAGAPQFNLYGMAGDPTFLERPILEISAHYQNKNNTEDLLAKLGIESIIVNDRVGMVTPRIIAMIINEAYFTVMEGTASREDIDTGMRLGTNYPMGPFDWAGKWGIGNIYDLLESLYLDTKDERYKISPLLKQEYLQQS
ncbi:MAG: 3-hydroxyacyl-CoA dehydrogenase [Bacteroidetes bacterium]|nr:MAG: 3-hydroxyacyl-CoA dehydrogenase [Bacteroidota bacterium]